MTETTRAPGSGKKPANSKDDELFSPVNVHRISGVIADQIKELIRDGRLKAGDRLPSERELCERFEVSRVTVRECLRILEANGLVAIRVGAHGGAFVTSPSDEQLGAGLADLLTLSPLTAAEVTEARMVFELGTISLVVERADDDDIAALRDLVEQGKQALAEDRYTMDLSAAFHIRVAACTHNPAIEMLVKSFHGPMLMSLKEARVAAPLMGAKGTEEHEGLVDAIEARDIDRATQIMRTHLARTANRVAQDDASA